MKILAQHIKCKLYLLQHHLCPKLLSHLSVHQRRRQKADQGNTRYRTEHPIHRWRNNWLKCIRQKQTSDVDMASLATEAKRLTSTCCVCDSRVCFYHFHIPWVYKVGFVAQNVPNFNMFVSWCSDQASFNLAAKVQTCRNGNKVRVTTKSLVLIKYFYSWWATVFLWPQTHKDTLPTWHFFIVSPQCENRFVWTSVQTVDKSILCAGLKYHQHESDVQSQSNTLQTTAPSLTYHSWNAA